MNGRAFRPSLHAELTSLIRDMILRHELKPAEWIPEAMLCEKLGVSRTPMRETLKVLAAEKLVELHPNRGAKVAMLVPEDVDQLLEAQSIIEGAAAALACARAGAEDVRAFEKTHKRMLTAFQRRDRKTYFSLNQQLHMALVAMSGNAALVATHSTIFMQVERARFLALDADRRWTDSVDQHNRILEALVARDGAKAKKLVEAHIDETRDALLRAVEQHMPKAEDIRHQRPKRTTPRGG